MLCRISKFYCKRWQALIRFLVQAISLLVYDFTDPNVLINFLHHIDVETTARRLYIQFVLPYTCHDAHFETDRHSVVYTSRIRQQSRCEILW